jgi:hypothetical protein
MKVKLTQEYQCSVNGYTFEHFNEGDIVEGVAAKYALSDGAGFIYDVMIEPVQSKKPKQTKPKYPKELK